MSNLQHALPYNLQNFVSFQSAIPLQMMDLITTSIVANNDGMFANTPTMQLRFTLITRHKSQEILAVISLT